MRLPGSRQLTPWGLFELKTKWILWTNFFFFVFRLHLIASARACVRRDRSTVFGRDSCATVTHAHAFEAVGVWDDHTAAVAGAEAIGGPHDCMSEYLLACIA
ncbi:unnamed protein product [Ectocarpus sp. 12 AP-2014]